MTGGIAVVGAGVGGLVVAAALRRRGVEATVFERAPRLRQGGTGLSLYANAVAALRELGLEDLLDGIAEPVERVVFLSARDGRRPLNEAVIGVDGGRALPPSVTVHRGELLDALAGATGREAVTFGARCVGFVQDAGGVTARFEDGGERWADLLVAADGAGSLVRRAICGEEGKERGRRWSGWQGVAPTRPAGLPERALVFVLSGSAGAGLFP